MNLRTIFAHALAACIAFAPVTSFAQAGEEIQRREKEIEAQERKIENVKRKLDEQKRELEDLRKELRVVETETELTMQLEGDVLFDSGKSALRPEARRALDKVAVVLAQFPNANVLIEGHTDSTGKRSVNLELSERRAFVVEEYLKKRAELAGIQFTTRGLGETDPIASNDTEEGRQQNRRVALTVTK